MSFSTRSRPIVPGGAAPGAMPDPEGAPRTGYEAERALFDAMARARRKPLRARLGTWLGR